MLVGEIVRGQHQLNMPMPAFRVEQMQRWLNSLGGLSWHQRFHQKKELRESKEKRVNESWSSISLCRS